jgi:hypothetical protein
MRGGDGGAVIHAEDRVNRMEGGELPHLFRHALRISTIEIEEVFGLRGGERAAVVGGDCELDAEPARRFDEGGGPVCRGRQDEQQAGPLTVPDRPGPSWTVYFLADAKYGLAPVE